METSHRGCIAYGPVGAVTLVGVVGTLIAVVGDDPIPATRLIVIDELTAAGKAEAECGAKDLAIGGSGEPQWL